MMHHRFGDYQIDVMGGFSFWNFLIVGVLGLVLLILIIVGILYFLRKDREKQQHYSTNRSLEILQERFAKGEINEQEYRDRKAVIEEDLNK